MNTSDPTDLSRSDEREFTISANGRRTEFVGRVLAVASSHKLGHLNHRGDFARRREICAACRWLEVTIYRSHGDVDATANGEPAYAYVVHTVGRSIVPGEVSLEKLIETTSPYEVVEVLTVRRNRGDRAEVFMPPQHARALAVAAQLDAGIRDAYVNRAVV